MQEQNGSSLCGKLLQSALQILQLLLYLRLRCRIIVWSGFDLVDQGGDLDSLWHRSAPQTMLVQNVEGNHIQVRFGAAYGLVAIDAEKPQEYLLYQVLNIHSTVAKAGRQEPA